MAFEIGGGITLGPGISIILPITATAGETTSVSAEQNTAITSFNPFSLVVNGTTPYTYFVSSGTLPTGVTLNASTGLVSGTPTVAYPLANVTFSVRDVNNEVATTTSTVSFTVIPPITATAGATTTVLGYQNSVITSFNPFSSVTNGVVPYTYFVSSGTLPTGVTLNASTGLVSGTPTATYTAANVTFRVRDANNVVATTTSTVSFTVNAALTATAGATTTVSGYQNSAISSFNPFSSVTGGYTPYTYFVSSGTLPTGITINPSTGLVSGTPTATYTAANVTFSVRDVNNVVASTTRIVSFTVNAALTATAGATTTVSANQNTAITSFNPFSSVTGGYTPYTYFVSSGTLPTGITINASTGLVSGTPTVIQGAANVTFSVRDVNNVTASTTSTVSFTVTSSSVTIQYLIVAGGGASGARGSPIPQASGYSYGAGGGAGGVRQGSVPITPGATYTITLGGGGSSTPSSTLGTQLGGSGNPTTFIGTGVSLTATGGGGGGGARPCGVGSTGANGGSGGGGAVWRPSPAQGPQPAVQTGYSGGTGNTPPTTPAQGFPGGTASPSGPPAFRGSAGGGGAGGAGGNGVQQAPPSPTSGISAGGAGITSTITGSNTLVGGGGQGGGFGSSPSPSISFGGGGSNTPQTAGVINTGGGGASSTNGSNGGGSGLVIVSAPTPAVTITGTYTTGPNGAGNVWYRFTSSGTIVY